MVHVMRKKNQKKKATKDEQNRIDVIIIINMNSVVFLCQIVIGRI